jgi:glycerate kinase
MKIVIAPDKFKGSLTGHQFCDAVEEGIKLSIPNAEILKIPLADGGDGTIEVIENHLDSKRIYTEVLDPLFRPIKASYLYVEDTNTAYIEMAEASGIRLLRPEEQNCTHTTTFGTGQQILHAINNGVKHIILGIGGSATNDCGIGMAAALGYTFKNNEGKEIIPTGEHLIEIETINADQLNFNLDQISIKIACDVTNPLFGLQGAAYVYGSQKGASATQIEALDIGLRHISKLFKSTFNKDVSLVGGGGAAGGIGAGCLVFLNAEMVSGITLIKSLLKFDEHIKDATWILTGEGKLDDQTSSGKTIQGVLHSAKEHNIPVAALCGSVDISIFIQKQLGLSYVTSTTQEPTTLQNAIKNAYGNLKFTAYNFGNTISGKF